MYKKWLILLLISVIVGLSVFLLWMQSTPEEDSDQKEQFQEITWSEAVELFHKCEVKMVVQTHELLVYITLEDNSMFVTREPHIDEVFQLTQNYQAECGKSLIIATE